MKNLKKFKKNNFDEMDRGKVIKKAKTKPKKLLRNEAPIKWSKKIIEDELLEEE